MSRNNKKRCGQFSFVPPVVLPELTMEEIWDFILVVKDAILDILKCK